MEVIDYVAFSALSYNNFPKGNNPDTNKPWTLSDLVKAGKIEGASFIEKENKIHVSKPELSALKGSSNPLHSYTLLDFISTSSGFRAAAFQSPSGEIVFSFKGTDFDLSSIKGYIEAGKDIANADAQIALGMSLNLPAQFADAEKFVNSVLASHPKADYTFTGHSLGGSLAQYMTYKTGHKSTTFNGPGIGSLVESVTGEKINYSAYENLSTNYANESDLIGNLWNNFRIGNNKVIRSSLNNTSAEDIMAVAKMQAIMTLMSATGLVPSTAPKIMKEGSAALERLAKNATPTGNHGMSDMMTKDGKLNDSTKKPDDFVLFMGYMAEGAKKAVEGGAFVFYVAGGLLTYGAEGVVKFVKTSKFVIEGLAYYGAEGVEKFIDTSEFVIEGLAYYIADGTIKFVDTTGNLIADGVWGGYSLLRGWFSNGLKGIQDLFNSATAAPPVRVDPLIFDLDGDGIKTTSLDKSRTYFDLDSNGFAERTAWVDASDGLLVLDRNNDGQITSGQELFGDQTLLANGVRATSGFEALKEFDSNRDGRIDAKDEVYSKLKIWRDLNGDGISQAEELKGLSDYNIASISLSSTSSNASDVMNNIQRRVGSFIKTDGSGGVIGEYLLNRNTLESHDLLDGKITMSEDILALPDLPGAGNVSSLRVAMAKDASGQLKKLVSDLVNADDTVNRNQLFTEAVYKWTGADIIDPKSRGNFIDARRLAVLEKFMGTDFAGSNGANPNENAAPLLNKAYRKLMNRLYASIAGNTFLKELVNKVEYTATVESGLVFDLSRIRAEIDKKLAVNPAAGRQMLDDFLRVAYGSGLEDSESLKDFCAHYATESSETAKIVYAVDRDAIIGSEKADSLYATAADTLLYGDAGDDMIYGMRGDDVLMGGEGADQLYGREGNDTYIFSKGDGTDYIEETDGFDTIKFGEGILPEDVVLKVTLGSERKLSLEITIKGTTDRIVVNGHFGTRIYSSETLHADNLGSQIERITFSNGVSWDLNEIYHRAHDVAGTENNDYLVSFEDGSYTYRGLGGNDSIIGGSANDFLYGDDGNDTIYGFSGNDVLSGGIGDDQLRGGTGDDIYLFSRGDGVDYIEETDGFDTIQFGEGISPNNVVARVVSTEGNSISLGLSIAGTNDKMTIHRHFGQYSYYQAGDIASPGNQIERVMFADGTAWNIDEIYRRAHDMVGTDGDDNFSMVGNAPVIYHGLDGNDVISGRSGKDILYGDAGDDSIFGGGTLIGGLGNDRIYGSNGDDVYIFNRGDGQDLITDTGGVDTIRFGDSICPDDIVIKRVGNGYGHNLELCIKDTDDKVAVYEHFGTNSYWGSVDNPAVKIERVEFADGTVWTKEDIDDRMHNRTGTDGADTIEAYGKRGVVYHGLGGDDWLRGAAGDDKLYGDDGNDTISGGEGNNLLVGGRGNDIINGFSGDDTYVFNRGDGADTIKDYGGTDTIQFGEGISPSDIVLKRVSTENDYNLEISIKSTEDKVTVVDYFGIYNVYGKTEATPGYMIEKIEFADGTIWTQQTIYDKMHNITGTGKDDVIRSYDDGSVEYHGLAGNDLLVGGRGNDNLYGDDGDDTIYGDGGNDLFVGGKGNDILSSYSGDDTYVFNRGDGKDVVTDCGGLDTLQFGEGIKPEDIVLKRVYKNSDYNLEISIKDTDDTVTFVSHFGSSNYSGWYATPGRMLDCIKFADGTVWTKDDIDYKMHHLTGTEENDRLAAYDKADVVYHGHGGNDMLVGGEGNDKLYGDDGDDAISGGEGNDLLVGGKGNDELSGSRGDDIYIFNKGDGSDVISECGGIDTIKFGEGITPDDVDVKRVYKSGSDYGYVLELSLKGTSDKISVKNYFGYYSYSGFHKPSPESLIEKVVFADGTVWTQDTINSKVHNITGTEDSETIQAFDDDAVTYYGLGGNDNLYGSKSNDKLYGGTGNDRISGGEGDDLIVGGIGDDYLDGYYGNDAYVFNKGDGSDTVYDANGNDDKIILGYNSQDIMFERSGNSLRLRMIGSSDSVTINSWYTNNSSQYKIETFKSATGSTITHTQIENLIQAMSSFQKDTGMTWEQALTAQPSQVQAIVQEYWTVPGV